MLKRRILTILFLALLVGIGWWGVDHQGWLIQAAGPLVVTWEDTPLFYVTNMLPGDSESKTIGFDNQKDQSVQIGLRAIKVEEDPTDPAISQVLDVVVEKVGGSVLYGQGSPGGAKTLADLLMEFDGSDSLVLGTLAPGDKADYMMTVEMPTWVGNEYQGAKVVFNLQVITDHKALDLPPECEHLRGTITAVIEGTEGKDVLRGTSANELIIGYGEKDNIKGNGGDDCLVGGDGDDHINGGTGNDVLIGGEGNDDLDGHFGNDLIYGGNGNDLLKGKQGQDVFYAGEGDDKVRAGSGEDLIFGGPGNDQLEGGGDDDLIFGEAGNDMIKGDSGDDVIEGGQGDDDMNGNSGDDHLTGDADTDKANGSSGTDTCDAETEIHCEL